ncbi:MAG: hypothetical protein PHC53_00275 [Patescibacteria group bacterium]|nr:hypothetical protein [Patescibacteria group bacterium]
MDKVPAIAPLHVLSTDQVRERRDSIMDEIQNLREEWSSLSALADPQHDEEIMRIFVELDKLERETLPEIERHLSRRAMERAA